MDLAGRQLGTIDWLGGDAYSHRGLAGRPEDDDCEF
jgi:hypothetical protein